MSFWKNIGKGDLVGAWHNLKDFVFSHLPKPLADFVDKFLDDEGQILWNAVVNGLSGVAAGKSIQEAGDIIWNDIKDQVPNKAKSDVMDALGVLLRASTPVTQVT